MTRCDYDSVFQRVFCVTLLGIAVTFTVILTNVFIDIDGLLANKEERKAKSHEEIFKEHHIDEMYQPDESTATTRFENLYNLETEKENDVEAKYRTRRSLDTKIFQSQVKNSKMKVILTNKLATLLEELDAEENMTTRKMVNENPDLTNVLEKIVDKKHSDVDKGKYISKSENKMRHLAMHNILLQGIIGHMDFNEVYKNIHGLMNSLNQDGNKRGSDNASKDLIRKKHELSKEDISSKTFSENKFLEEIVKCKSLQNEIMEAGANNDRTKLITTRRAGGLSEKKWDNYVNEGKPVKYTQTPQVLIKTIIDIKTLKNDKNKTTINEDNIKGLIKFIYNGKAIKFSRLEEEEDKDSRQEIDEVKQDKNKTEDPSESQNIEVSENADNMVSNFMDKAILNYLKKHPKLDSQYKIKRLKRNVKIQAKETTNERKKNDKSKEKNNKKNDEELYVEIETRFDSKGINGENKKKFIKKLVNKIRKAIHADVKSFQLKTKKHETPIKKRVQNPLDTNSKKNIMEKMLVPRYRIVHRNLDPISKITGSASKPKNNENSEETRKKSNQGLNYFTNHNSHEIDPVDTDYENFEENNGISERFQQPLNSDIIIKDESENGKYFNIGDLKLHLKEIDGTGFSIGFNQYVGDAPDPENIKLFTGLQQLIQTYHQNYDDYDNRNEIMNIDGHHSNKIKKRDVNDQTVDSFKDEHTDCHTNELKVIFDNLNLPYYSLSQIIEDQNKKVTVDIKKDDVNNNNNLYAHSVPKKTDLPLIIDDNIFEKRLKPSEIFGIADLLDRSKRSAAALVKVKKFSNVNLRKKSKLNRFIKTQRKSKRILVNNKRSKRQIENIRIIAEDSLPALQRHSNENVFIVSEETVADRNMLKEVEVPEQEAVEPLEENEYLHHHHVYEAPPQSLFDQYASPNLNIFATRSRHNALMTKYPHLFIEELTTTEDESPVFYNKLLNSYSDWQKNSEVSTPPFLATPIAMPTSDLASISSAITDAISPNANYKLTVKVVPNNNTDNIHSGFKEIHTSINKSVNRNGLLYSSQVNLSEVSKIENLYPKQIIRKNLVVNNSGSNNLDEAETKFEASTSYNPLVNQIKEQQEKLKMLLKQHRLKIDEQLDSLRKEKLNIESIIIPSDKKLNTIDVMVPLNPPQILYLNKSEAGQLISSGIMKLHDSPQLNGITTNTSKTTNYLKKDRRQAVRNNQPAELTPDPEKMKIMKTIQRNENLTNIILYKIDKNTNLLQLFLQKLSERIETTTQNSKTLQPEKKPTIDIRKQGDWKNSYLQEPFFRQGLPLEAFKNDTHMVIPFVYAYQHPYPERNKNSNHIANVVYQGLIQSNTQNAYNNYANSKQKQDFRHEDKGKKVTPGKREVNQTFFFDSLDSDYKIEPVSSVKTFNTPLIKNSFTKINLTEDYRLL